jgi:hypothetical protein
MFDMKILTFLLFFLSTPMVSTPGALCSTTDPDFDGLRYPEQIVHCKRHLKDSTITSVARRYGIPRDDYDLYEFDHLIPIALGGSNAEANIWPQPLGDAHEKDVLELRLYLSLKRGQITQKDAVAHILAWRP